MAGEERRMDDTAVRVVRALMVIPVKKEDPPGLVLNGKTEEGTRTGSLTNANGPPRVMGPFTKDETGSNG